MYNHSMRQSLPILITAILFGSFLAMTTAQEDSAQQQQQRKKIRKVKRVAKPTFDGSKGDIYFKDVFKDGLVGDRPASNIPNNIAASKTAAEQGTSEPDQSAGWSTLIDGTTIEDEVKSLNQELAKSVTTPVKFKTTYNDVRRTMSMLSMSFAIIREFDGEVRWKDHASAAQAALQKAATNARSNASDAFNYCNARKFDLEDLVRGGSFAETEKPPEELEWGDVIGRSETMERLETSDQRLKQWTADEDTFAKQKNKIISEAQWVAAIAEVIAKEGMDDADVEEYVAFCEAMKKAALETVAATNADDFEAASRFANLISQSCNNCHQDWR